MFDLGFWELMLIMVVTLLVVGPERLPSLARTAGLWIGKLRGFVNTVKADINRELAADELQRTLAKQAQVPELEEIVTETEETLSRTSRPAQSSLPPGEAPDSEHPANTNRDGDTADGAKK